MEIELTVQFIIKTLKIVIFKKKTKKLFNTYFFVKSKCFLSNREFYKTI